MRVAATMWVALSTCNALHMPRHSIGIRPLRKMSFNTLPAVATAKLDVERMILEERMIIAQVEDDERAVRFECELCAPQALDQARLGTLLCSRCNFFSRGFVGRLRENLVAFVEAGYDKLLSSLSLRSMRARVDGIVKRRHRLAQQHRELREQAGAHHAMLERLERVRARLQRRHLRSEDAS